MLNVLTERSYCSECTPCLVTVTQMVVQRLKPCYMHERHADCHQELCLPKLPTSEAACLLDARVLAATEY